MATAKTKRNLTPSRSITMGTAIGGPVAIVLTALASAVGVPVTPELSAAVGTIVTAVLSYFARGGRAGEP